MRNSIEKWLQNIWYSDNTPPWYLRMLVPLYRAVFKFDHRHSGSDHPETTPKIPLLVVGNITVGGSGKTPLVIALCKTAEKMGVKVGVASTGYGRKSTQTLEVHAGSDTTDCGDEPVLIAIRAGVPVVVASRRQDAISRLRQMNVDLIISDDGLQTAGLQRDIEICVVDGSRGMGNGYLLPAGPLREASSRLLEFDYVVSNGKWLAEPAGCRAGLMVLDGQVLSSLGGAGLVTSDVFFSQPAQSQIPREVHLFAAIGNPDRFFNAVRQLNQHAVNSTMALDHWHEHRFPDHHAFIAADFESVPSGASIVMTEKDAVKCRKLGLDNAWCLPVDAVLDEDFVQWFCQQLKLLKQDKP